MPSALTLSKSSSLSGSAALPGPRRRLPALAHSWRGAIRPLDVEAPKRKADFVFLALPDSAAAELAPALDNAGLRVVDLSGAFRLRDQTARERWYPETKHVPPGLAYGLTEHERDSVRSARLVANPGCYPTTALMPLKPLAAAGLLLLGVDVIIDAKSGV